MMHQVSSNANISKTIHSPVSRSSQLSPIEKQPSVTTILPLVILRLIEGKNDVIVTATA
jgi:hypothetical protein